MHTLMIYMIIFLLPCPFRFEMGNGINSMKTAEAPGVSGRFCCLTNEEKDYYLKVLNRVANRESTPQFFHKFPTEQEQYFLGREEVSNQDFLGLVLDYNPDEKKVKLEQRNYFKVGDVVEFFGPNMETFSYEIHKIENDLGESIEVANHPNMIVYLPMEVPLEKFDIMRVKLFDKDRDL